MFAKQESGTNLEYIYIYISSHVMLGVWDNSHPSYRVENASFPCTHFDAIMFTMVWNHTKLFSFVLISGNALVNYLYGSREGTAAAGEKERTHYFETGRQFSRVALAREIVIYALGARACHTGSNYLEKNRHRPSDGHADNTF